LRGREVRHMRMSLTPVLSLFPSPCKRQPASRLYRSKRETAAATHRHD
jgi:hypothetical protein